MSSSQLRAGVALTYVNIGANTAFMFVVTPLMLQKLGASGFGMYALIGAFAGYLGLLDLGLGAAVTRYVAASRARNDERTAGGVVSLSLAIQCGMSLVAMLVGVALYHRLGSFFGETLSDAQLRDARAMYGLLLVNIAVSLPLGTFSATAAAYERFVFLRTAALARVALRAGLVLAVLYAGRGAVAVVVVDTVLNVSIAIATGLYVLTRLRFRLYVPRLGSGLVREILWYSFFVFLAAVVDQLYWRVGQVVLGSAVGTRAVAVFALSVQLIFTFIQLSTAVSGVLLPRVTTMVVSGEGSDRLTTLFARTARYQVMLLGLGVSGFALFGKPFITLWAGPQYESAWAVTMVMLVPLSVPLFQNVGLEILRAKNLHAFRSVTYLLTASATGALAWILAPRYGAMGAAIGTAVALVVGNIFVINVYYHSRIGLDMVRFFREVFRGLAAVIAGSFAFGVLTSAAPAVSWGGLFVRVVVFTCVYVGLAWRIGMNDGERELVRSFVRRCSRAAVLVGSR
jgi:O-antigen/teichoic acid export membrane protein